MNAQEYFPWIDIAVMFGGMAVLGTYAYVSDRLAKRKIRRIQSSINASVSHAKRSLKRY